MLTNNTKSIRGFTLVEIIIAVSIFVFLSVLLVEFLQRGLDLWKTGENRGDVYERGQIVMEQIKKDLSGVFNEPVSRTVITNNFNTALYIDAQDSKEPSFYSGLDQNNNPWLYVIRMDNDEFYTLVSTTPAVSPTYKVNKERIVYYLETSAGKPQLIRGVISETVAAGFWQPGLGPQNPITPTQSSQAFDDVLYLGGIFSGTVPAWDSRITSSPPAPAGTYLLMPQNLPATVKITLDIKSMPLNSPKITLTDSLVGDTATINLPRTLLGAGSFLKVDNEWLMVQSKSYYKLNVLRAQRNTILAPHNGGSEVQYGETMESTFYLPTNIR
ncbi:MAG: type II secretion system protein [Planctomycetes bacterium]|nr:type II secretion system protein [Planctomycetota bacterium]